MSDNEGRRPESHGGGLTARQQYWFGVYLQLYGPLRDYLAHYVRRPEDADALVQEVLLDLLACRHDPCDVRAYAYTLAWRRLCSYWQRARRRKHAAVRWLLDSWQETETHHLEG